MSRTRLTGGLTVGLLLLAAGSATAAPQTAGRPAVKAIQQLAVLDHGTTVFSHPRSSSKPVATVSATRPLTGERTTLPVVGQAAGTHGSAWLKVLLPGRPDGHSGWLLASSTRSSSTRWRIIVPLSLRRVMVFHSGRLIRTFPAVVGKPSTPTPMGHFFVEENVKLGPLAVGAPYALALSARSNVLQEFDGGPGQIALHGTDNIGGTLGTAESHGCMRLTTQDITWLANRIGPGVPVTIVP